MVAVSIWTAVVLASLGLVTTVITAYFDLVLTRMKLAFAKEVLDESRTGGGDAESARKDLDAVRKFMASAPSRAAGRPRWPRLRSRRDTDVSALPARDEPASQPASAAQRAAAA